LCECLEVDAIAVLALFFYRLGTIKDLVNYIKMVNDAASTTPLIYYDFSYLTGIKRNDI